MSKQTVVFDFDGVIHSYTSGWQGVGVIPDPPVPGIKEAIDNIRAAGYEVVVVSTRCSTREGLKAVRDYLWEHRIKVDAVKMEKPPAVKAVVMPCKIGDKVYRIAEGNYHSNYKPFVQELTVTEISWKKEKYGTKDLGFAIIADGIRYRFSSIGKSVFLSREEAETKLNGGVHHA